MKKLFLLLILLPLIQLTVLGQKKVKEGEIKFEMEFEGLDPMAAQFLKDSEMVMTFNQEFSKVDMDMGIAKNSIIMDLKKQEGTMLLDAMGSNYLVKMSPEDISEDIEEDYEIKKTGEFKEIAGYNCEKIIITPAEGEPIEMFMTDLIKLDGQYQAKFSGLQGFPMAYEIDQGGMKMSMKAIEVIERKVDASEFAIPEGYEELSADDLKRMGGGF